jgi:hypothetical protein
MDKQKTFLIGLLVCSALVGTAIGAQRAKASDHDDGTTDIKSANTNFTDLFVFNEKSQNTTLSTTDTDLIAITNINPRSLPQQQYYYSTSAHYDLHFTRVGTTSNNDDTPKATDDVILRYTFAAPDQNNQQAVTVTAIKDGQTLSGATTTGNAAIETTPLGMQPINNTVSMGGQNLTVFAGLREDPFFFDVERFFQVRSSAAMIAAGKAPASSQITFSPVGTDFTAGYNVLSIVTRIPLAFLQGPTQATTFDAWETISIPQ